MSAFKQACHGYGIADAMGVSVYGFISGREGEFGWTDPNEEQFPFHIAQVGELGAAFADI